jgi:hypothetical protein
MITMAGRMRCPSIGMLLLLPSKLLPPKASPDIGSCPQQSSYAVSLQPDRRPGACWGTCCSLAHCEVSFFLPSFTGVFMRCLLCVSLHARICAWKNSGRGNTNSLTNVKVLALPLPLFFHTTSMHQKSQQSRLCLACAFSCLCGCFLLFPAFLLLFSPWLLPKSGVSAPATTIAETSCWR